MAEGGIVALLDEVSEMFLGVFALLNLSFEEFLEHLDAVETLGVLVFVRLALLDRLLVDFSLDCLVVVLQLIERGLELGSALFDRS